MGIPLVSHHRVSGTDGLFSSLLTSIFEEGHWRTNGEESQHLPPTLNKAAAEPELVTAAVTVATEDLEQDWMEAGPIPGPLKWGNLLTAAPSSLQRTHTRKAREPDGYSKGN